VITEITKIGVKRFMILIYDKIKWLKKRRAVRILYNEITNDKNELLSKLWFLPVINRYIKYRNKLNIK
jgi:hypothetical protein